MTKPRTPTDALPDSNWLLAPQFVERIDVRDADIDDFNHVNNVVYLGWIARTAWAHSKALGFDFAAYRNRDCGLSLIHI